MLYPNCILLIGVIFSFSNGEEKLDTYCSINGETALQYVSEKFLSISIDPAVLVAGLNLSDSSLILAKHLSPAYIRIAGPSTKFVKYLDNEDEYADRLSEDGNSVVVTPSMWFGINGWLSLANLIPVFGINDAETTGGLWNPKSTMPLLEISDRLNVSCYWQLGFDSSQKSDTQYMEDLNILHHALSAFPERKETWKIVGSDISYLPKEQTEKTIEKLRDVATAVMWEPQKTTADTFPENDLGWKILQRHKHNPSVKIWTTAPKLSEPISFASALLWAMQVGEAAKCGYEVVFRQPMLDEIFSDTPAYWFSLLHKKLMGSNVLDAKTTIYYPGSAVYAHCTRQQNASEAKGALTVMMVNNNLQKYKIKFKLGTAKIEGITEVHSYILTSSTGNTTDIFLNGKKLTLDVLSESEPFEPKRRRTKLKSYVILEVPPLSVGFFTLPDAKVPVCVANEGQTDFTLKEPAEEQYTTLSQETVLDLPSRGSFINSPTLEEITQKLKKDIKLDKRFYPGNSDELKRDESVSEEEKIKSSGRKSLIEKTNLAAKRKEQLKNFFLEKTKATEAHKTDNDIESKSKNLELTSEEIGKVLKDRAKARAAQRNIIFTDEELDVLLHKASKKFMESKLKRTTLPENMRNKRDINMQILERQTKLESSGEHTNGDFEQLHGINQEFSQNMFKRSQRKPRDVNLKLLDIRSKLADNIQRIEDKRYEILGNTQTMKENIKDRIRNLKYRFKRDINMDLLKLKTEGHKKVTPKDEEKKLVKSLFRHKEAKEATIRKPGQTSDELLEELEEKVEESIDLLPVMPKIEVYAELAQPAEETDEEDGIDFVDTNNKPKKFGIFDKITNNPTPSSRKKSKNKDANALEENIKFLTTSEEFTDIEEDFPCIHEYFGPGLKKSEAAYTKNAVHELGETDAFVKNPRKVKKGRRKMSELGDTMVSNEKDPFQDLRLKREVGSSESSNNSDKAELRQGDELIEEDVEKTSYNEIDVNEVATEKPDLSDSSLDSKLSKYKSHEDKADETKLNEREYVNIESKESHNHFRNRREIKDDASVFENLGWSKVAPTTQENKTDAYESVISNYYFSENYNEFDEVKSNENKTDEGTVKDPLSVSFVDHGSIRSKRNVNNSVNNVDAKEFKPVEMMDGYEGVLSYYNISENAAEFEEAMSIDNKTDDKIVVEAPILTYLVDQNEMGDRRKRETDGFESKLSNYKMSENGTEFETESTENETDEGMAEGQVGIFVIRYKRNVSDTTGDVNLEDSKSSKIIDGYESEFSNYNTSRHDEYEVSFENDTNEIMNKYPLPVSIDDQQRTFDNIRPNHDTEDVNSGLRSSKLVDSYEDIESNSSTSQNDTEMEEVMSIENEADERTYEDTPSVLTDNQERIVDSGCGQRDINNTLEAVNVEGLIPSKMVEDPILLLVDSQEKTVVDRRKRDIDGYEGGLSNYNILENSPEYDSEMDGMMIESPLSVLIDNREINGDKRRKRDVSNTMSKANVGDNRPSKMVKEDNEEDSSRELQNKDNVEGIVHGKDELHVHEKETKQHLKNLKHFMAEDKLRYEEEKMKNKLKLAHLKKLQEDQSKQEDILEEIRQFENEKTSELLEHLQLLKKILGEKKKEIDKFILKESILHEKVEEEKRSKNKGKQALKEIYSSSETHKKKSPHHHRHIHEELKAKSVERRNRVKNDAEMSDNEDTLHTLRLTKRSLFDKYTDGFGKYKPVTVNVQPWRPSDILSLKRDVNLLKSKKLKPANDYQMHKSIFDQNRYSNFRNKRNINSESNDVENDIDSAINEIEKDSEFTHPKIIIGKTDNHRPSTDTSEIRSGSESTVAPIENITTPKPGKDENKQETTTVDPIIYYTFDDDFGPEIESDTEMVTDCIASALYKDQDVSEQGQKIFRSFITNIAGFFRGIGSKIENYVKSITIG